MGFAENIIAQTPYLLRKICIFCNGGYKKPLNQAIFAPAAMGSSLTN
jgi:hypothetical protein